MIRHLESMVAGACGKGPGSRGRVGKPVPNANRGAAGKKVKQNFAGGLCGTMNQPDLYLQNQTTWNLLTNCTMVGIQSLNGRAVMSSTMCIKTPNSTGEHTKVFTFLRQRHQIPQ